MYKIIETGAAFLPGGRNAVGKRRVTGPMGVLLLGRHNVYRVGTAGRERPPSGAPSPALLRKNPGATFFACVASSTAAEPSSLNPAAPQEEKAGPERRKKINNAPDPGERSCKRKLKKRRKYHRQKMPTNSSKPKRRLQPEIEHRGKRSSTPSAQSRLERP